MSATRDLSVADRPSADAPQPFSAAAVARVREALFRHYRRNRRDLPWREDTDPYRIWVSEVMLQQTRVETVLNYYDAWLRRFPDVETLAGATEDEVLKAWEGLGYYRRARHLHRAARVLREDHGGELPPTYEGLRELPGVGAYTAGAVASIAFGEAAPAVDGNVRRVLARLHDVAQPGGAWLRKTAAALVDPDAPGDWNQALMELGATVCTPTSPECGACPLAGWCRARERGTQEVRPAPVKRAEPARVEYATAVVVDGWGRALVVRRPKDGLLGGMWSFPEAEQGGGGMGPVEAAGLAAREAGAELPEDAAATLLEPVGHRFTHIDATYRPVLLEGAGDGSPAADAGADRARWVPLETLDGGSGELALPVAQQKIAAAALEALAAAGPARAARDGEERLEGDD